MEIGNQKISAEIGIQPEVKIYLDKNGLLELVRDLQRLEKIGDHIHYLSEEWGGHALIKDQNEKDHTPVDHIKITLVDT